MPGSRWRNRKALAALALLGLALTALGIAWLERTPLRSWYYVRGLARADEGDRQRWAQRVAELGEPAIPGLLDCLTQPDDATCVNAQAGLAQLAAHWGPHDGRSVELAVRLGRVFGRLSPCGQRAVLEVSAGWFAPRADGPAPGLVPACVRVLAEAAPLTDADVQGAALALAAALLEQAQGTEALSAAREVARAGLRSAAPANRLGAVQLGLREGMDLLEQVVVLLADPVVEVRRAALLAVAPSADVREEALLPSLHDADPEVRRLCEAALRARGLRPEHLHLGRLLTDPSPSRRLMVLDHIHHARDLDPGLWLRRLSHDASPAVRVAAVRVMSALGARGAGNEPGIDLSDRIDQMARGDPSPTVCQIARFYLEQRQAHPR